MPNPTATSVVAISRERRLKRQPFSLKIGGNQSARKSAYNRYETG